MNASIEVLEGAAPEGLRPQLFARGRLCVIDVRCLLAFGRTVDEDCKDFPCLDLRDIEAVALTRRLTRHDRT